MHFAKKIERYFTVIHEDKSLQRITGFKGLEKFVVQSTNSVWKKFKL